MSLKRLSGPSGEPVTLAEAKLHLRVTETSQDALISALITAARGAAEQITRRQLMTSQFLLTLDRFPWPGATDFGGWPPIGIGLLPGGGRGIMTARLASWYTLELPKAPLQTVDEIKYLDSLGAEKTLAATTDYVIDSAREPARLAPAYGKYWPSTLPQINAVQVKFTAGYGNAAAVPEGIKAWIKLMIGALYENRELVVVLQRGQVAELPFVDGLLDEFRVGYAVDYSVR